MSDIVSAVVLTMERLDTGSAAVMRESIYKALAPIIDIEKVVSEVRTILRKDYEARVERANNLEARRRTRVARLPELQAIVQTGPASSVRELLAKEMSATEISIAIGVSKGYVKAVRDFDKAKDDRAALKKMGRNKYSDKLTRLLKRKSWIGDPTKERLRQAGGERPEEITEAGGLKSHKFHWPVDQIKHWLTMEEYAAAERFFRAFADAGGKSRISAYGGASGGGDPSRRLALTPQQESAARVYQVFYRGLGVNKSARDVAINFVLGERVRGHDKVLSLVEWGKRYGQVGGPDQARGIAQGLLWMVCAILAAIWREHVEMMRNAQKEVLRAIAADRELSQLIARNRSEELIRRLCSRMPTKQWIVRRVVDRLMEAAHEQSNRVRERA